MLAYRYAAFFVFLYDLRPLLYNWSHYLYIWNSAFCLNMACMEGCCGEKGVNFDIMKKNPKQFFFHKKRVIFIRNYVRNPKKMVPMLYSKHFWWNWEFFKDLARYDIFIKSAKYKKSKNCTYHDNAYTNIEKLCELHDQQWMPSSLGPTATF